MQKFNNGDKVRCVYSEDEAQEKFIGKEGGVVVGGYTTSIPYVVFPGSEQEIAFFDNELEMCV